MAAADATFGAWSTTTTHVRADLPYAAWRVKLERSEALAELMTREQGKPLKASHGVGRRDPAHRRAVRARSLHCTTLLDGVIDGMAIYREETFGPVGPVVTYDEVDQ